MTSSNSLSLEKNKFNFVSIFSRYHIPVIILTALTAGGRREAEMATPINDPEFPPSTDKATPIPDGRAIKTPTQSPLGTPL